MSEPGRDESRGKPWGFVGAILLTGYLGGAIAAHLRAGSSVFQMVFPLLIGLLVWGAVCWLSPEGRRLPWLRAMH
jgi:hypothetical protein